jgi:hypothetical protein
MILDADYAEEILSSMSFTQGEGQLENNAVLDELLYEMASDFPYLLDDHSYVFSDYVRMAWWHSLTKEQRKVKREDRPEMPEGWWPGGRTLKTMRCR